jgi:uncharacterized membrane protein YidH (DUF202 family)
MDGSYSEAGTVTLEPSLSFRDVLSRWKAWRALCPVLAPAFADLEKLERSHASKKTAARPAGAEPLLWDAPESFVSDVLCSDDAGRALLSIFADFSHFDACFARELQAARREAGTSGAAGKAIQLSLAAHVHRLAALWLARCPAFAFSSPQSLLVPIAALSFWQSGEKLSELLSHAFPREQPLQEEGEGEWGGETVGVFWVRGSAEWLSKAQLLATGTLVARGDGCSGERVYFDDRLKHCRQELKEGRAAKKGLLLELRGEHAAVAVGSQASLLESRAVAEAIVGGSVTEGRVPKSVAKKIKKGFAPAVRARSVRQLYRVIGCANLSVVWDSKLVLSVATGKKTAVAFPFQVVRLVRSGPGAQVPEALKAALDTLVPAPGFSEFAAGGSMLLQAGSARWDDALKGTTEGDWLASLRFTRLAMRGSGGVAGSMQPEAFDVDEESEGAALLSGDKKEAQGVGEGLAGIKLKASAALDPKTYWANERTLLSWLQLAIFLCVSSAQLLSFGNRSAQIAGIVMAPATVLVCIYALLRFHFRNLAVRDSATSRGQDKKTVLAVVDTWGPWVVVPLICVMLVLLTIMSFAFG